MQYLENAYINGNWYPLTGPDRFPLVNPATEECIAKVTMATESDVNQAVAAANQALPAWSNTSNKKRA
ncbi:MAG: aldehyde dehydrogenase family protein, partial [Lentilitoribacter sp.]